MLEETVLEFEQHCSPTDVARILLFLSDRASPGCQETAKKLAASNLPIPVVIYPEIGRHFGQELQELVTAQTDCSHAVFWTADREAEPKLGAHMIQLAKEHPAAVINISCYMPGGYPDPGKSKFIRFRDAAFAKMVRILYHSKQTDPLHLLCVFPVEPYIHFDLHEPFMSFCIELNLLFDRSGAQIIEVPLRQQPRKEGKSNLSLKDRLRFFVPVFRLRFLPKRKLYK
ncbi:MAG: hypothetical protein LBR73_09070 [Oscillospiraceae bacterium]|nr:hypothetical protein [Oscillospiraceae bacterium]